MTPSNSLHPKIGLALSGGSGRAIAHIGVLEVFQEQGIPIDYIAACSSGTAVAASFACGTMGELKDLLKNLDKKSLLELVALEKKEGGIFSLERFEEKLRDFTLGKNFEEVRPLLNFIACDIETAEPVSLRLGDLARASRISSSVPGLFSPVRWGNRLLVDGGLFSVVPTKEVRDMGADLVIGVDIAASPYIVHPVVSQGYSFVKKSFPVRMIGHVVELVDNLYTRTRDLVFYNQSDYFGPEPLEDPNLFSVLDQAITAAAKRQKQGLVDINVCDLMLAPDVKKYGPLSVNDAEAMYGEGRRVATVAIPKIRKLIADYQRVKA